jgi:hypothetical protein
MGSVSDDEMLLNAWGHGKVSRGYYPAIAKLASKSDGPGALFC